jgi:hypothetical protein
MPKRTKMKNLALSWYGPEIESIVRGATEPGLWALGQVVKRAAESRAPRSSGTLQASSFVATTKRTDYVRHRGDRHKRTMTRILQKVTPTTALVGFGAWYSNIYEDTGAKRHAIPYVGKTGRARRRKTLQIPGVGFRTGVSHPGVKPQPFLAPALEATKASGTEAFAREVREELEREL